MTARATSEPRHHGNRHGRSEEARIAVLEAADDLLVERGFAGVTIEGIAARAGVAKQTIYRWWGSKTAILFDALSQDAEEFFTTADTGDLRSDLRVRLREVAAFLSTTDAGAVARALAGQAQHDPAVATRFAAEFTARQRALDRAIDQLTGPVYYRVLITGQPVPPEFTDAVIEAFLASGGSTAPDRTSEDTEGDAS
jgi:AcrR family transcriptional regulator